MGSNSINYSYRSICMLNSHPNNKKGSISHKNNKALKKSSSSKSIEYLKVFKSSQLSGHIKISGAKNSALVLMAASLLTKEAVHLINIPQLTDISVMSNLLVSMGVDIKRNSNEIEINPSRLNLLYNELPFNIYNSLRASFFCIGPLLARLGKAQIPLPGGCQIGARPIDEHIQALRLLGAKVDIEDGQVIAKTISPQQKLIGNRIRFNCKSVGATETLIMAATLAKGKTILENCAQEPEITDLAMMLNKMGAKIRGAGTSEVLIEGVDNLKGCSYKVMPDRIEAGTFLIASAITRSPLIISPAIPEHLEAVISKLRECGCSIKHSGQTIQITPGESLKGVDIKTMPFPGFPTDLQAPFMALMATTKGISKVEETVFENRMQHVNELKKMGVSIELKDNTAFITGSTNLKAASMTGSDLRSCAALVLASFVSKGASTIEGIEHLDRGYEDFEKKLFDVGANILRERKIN